MDTHPDATTISDTVLSCRFFHEGEDNHVELGLRPPSYFGASSTDTATLGTNIATDPRFACQATQLQLSNANSTDDVPFELVLRLTDDFS